MRYERNNKIWNNKYWNLHSKIYIIYIYKITEILNKIGRCPLFLLMATFLSDHPTAACRGLLLVSLPPFRTNEIPNPACHGYSWFPTLHGDAKALF